MREKSSVLIITLILIILGGATLSIYLFYGKFNFYKSRIDIEGSNIQETLYFKTNKDYHTLFRNFESSISYKQEVAEIRVNLVNCEEGMPYVNDRFTCHNLDSEQEECLPFTEHNELGCTFRNTYGFKKGVEYEFSSNYDLLPYTLINSNGEYYIKFVPYSVNRHPLLIRGYNFFVEGDAKGKKVYLPNEPVVLYVKTDYVPGKRIIKEDIKSKSVGYLVSLIFAALFPGILFFSAWLFFGREIKHSDVPESLSFFPRKRKAWEVAAYFHPPFSVIDKEFFSSILLDFKRRKIIEIKTIDDEAWIKIPNKAGDSFDDVEGEFIILLKTLYDKLDEKHKKGEFANLKKMIRGLGYSERTKAISLQKKIRKDGKKYLRTHGTYIASLMIIAVYISYLISKSYHFTVFYFISYIFISYASSRSAILTSYREDFYAEYQHWQAFRKYLKAFPSMKDSPHEAVVLWERYLVYATALGVSKEVIKKLKDWGIVNEDYYHAYTGVYSSSNSFAASSGTGGSGGGVGGGGGGGVGGGGGGGR